MDKKKKPNFEIGETPLIADKSIASTTECTGTGKSGIFEDEREETFIEMYNIALQSGKREEENKEEK